MNEFERYIIDRLLGAGGMGQVYLAQDSQLDRPVALKLLRGASDEMIKSAVREARNQARVVHDHVGQVYEVGERDGKPFIAMQYVDGVPFDEAAQQMEVPAIVAAMRDVVDAVQAAHTQGLVHSDLKPGNVLVCRTESGCWHPYVLDFGIAVEHMALDVTAAPTVRGTPAYMSPEQIRGDRRLDGRSDVFALGTMLFELLAGRRPFLGETSIEVMVAALEVDPPPLKRLRPDLPIDLCAIVEYCLEKEPDRRYQSARLLAEDLSRFLAGEEVMARKIGRMDRMLRFVRRHRAISLVSAAGLTVAVGFGGFALFSQWKAAEQAELAARFGSAAAKLGDRMRMVQMAPGQDIGRARLDLQRQMDELAAEIEHLGQVALGPGNVALGKAALAISEPERARDRFLKAISSGYETPEAWYGLGIALAELYRQEWGELRNFNATLRAPRLEKVQMQLQQPALRALDRAAPEDQFSIAMQALLAEDWDRASEGFLSAAGADPIRYEALVYAGDAVFERAWSAFRDGRTDDAAVDLEEAGKAYRRAQHFGRSDPRPWRAMCQTAELSIELQRLGIVPELEIGQLTEPCDRAVELDSGRVNNYERRAGLYQGLGARALRRGDDPMPDLDRAVADAERAIELSPSSLNGHYYLGVAEALRASALDDVALRQLALDRSTWHLQRCLEQDPLFIPAHNSLSIVAMDRGDLAIDVGTDALPSFRLAVRSLESATALAADLPPLYNNLGRANILVARQLVDRGEDPSDSLEAARTSLSRAMDIAPDYVSPHYNLGFSYLTEALWHIQNGIDALEAVEAASGAYARSLEIDPKYVWSRIARTDLYLDLAEAQLRNGNDASRAIEVVRKGLGEAGLGDDVACNRARLELMTARNPLTVSKQDHLMRARKMAFAGDCLVIAAEVDLERFRLLGDEDSIRFGMESVEAEIDQRPGNAAALRIRGLLEVERAGAASEDNTSRQTAAQSAIESFAAADRLTPGWAGLYVAEKKLAQELVGR